MAGTTVANTNAVRMSPCWLMCYLWEDLAAPGVPLLLIVVSMPVLAAAAAGGLSAAGTVHVAAAATADTKALAAAGAAILVGCFSPWL